MTTQINPLQISYPDFVLNTVIDPEHFDTNNLEILTKINEVIDEYNAIVALDIPIDSPFIEAVSDIQTIIVELKAYSDQHRNYKNNPHEVTATQVTATSPFTALLSDVQTLINKFKADSDVALARADVFDIQLQDANNVYTAFGNLINTAEEIMRVPYLFNGGDFGDTSPIGLTLDGGDL